ncbi:MAG TPA: HEAT repeat domain-containing protein [Candidatus Binatia bacterium]|jgi:HEAT repeat protein
MDKTLEQLLTLTEKGTVEQRCAALLVLGALKLDNARIIKTVAAALAQPNPVLKDYALRYFEEVQPKAATSLLGKFLDDPDKEIQERSVRLLSRGGQEVIQPLLKNAPTAPRVWQLNVARVLSTVRGKAALKGLLQMLRSGTDEFNKSICDLMTPWVREMDAKEQELLYDEVEKFAAKLDAKQQRPAVVSSIRLLGQLGRPQARKWLFGFVAREHHSSLRSHALAALLHCLRKEDLRKDEHAKLFSVLEEAEFSEVGRLALDLLDTHELPEDSRSALSRLLTSPHASVQQFALRKMGDFGTPATVRTLIVQLGDSDYRRRDIAAHSLHKIPEARAALIKELLACEDPSKAWSIAELLSTFEGKWRQDVLEALWKRLQAAIAAEDRIQNSFMHVLKKADGEEVYERLAAEGAKLFKAKKYKEAIPFLAPLKDFSEFKPEHKFLLGVAQLKAHPQRPQPAVELLLDVYRNSAFPLLESLKKEKKLEPEDIFSLGFTFAERPGDERDLGRGLLEHLVTRVPRTKIGKSAKNKLKLLK